MLFPREIRLSLSLAAAGGPGQTDRTGNYKGCKQEGGKWGGWEEKGEKSSTTPQSPPTLVVCFFSLPPHITNSPISLSNGVARARLKSDGRARERERLNFIGSYRGMPPFHRPLQNPPLTCSIHTHTHTHKSHASLLLHTLGERGNKVFFSKNPPRRGALLREREAKAIKFALFIRTMAHTHKQLSSSVCVSCTHKEGGRREGGKEMAL